MNSTTPPAPTGTAAMLVNDVGQYLLHLRDANKPEICDPGTWSLIGGGPEPGESPHEAITRELWEEARLSIPDLVPFALLEDRRPDGVTKGHIQIYLGHWNGDAAALPLTEGIMLHWFDAHVMPRLTMCPWAEQVILQHRTGVTSSARVVLQPDGAQPTEQP